MNEDFGCWFAMGLVGLPPMLILLTALAPGYVERTRAVMRERPKRCFLLGLVNFLFFGGLSLLSEVPFAPVAIVGAISLIIVLPLLSHADTQDGFICITCSEELNVFETHKSRIFLQAFCR
jgi:hypothetical protein